MHESAKKEKEQLRALVSLEMESRLNANIGKYNTPVKVIETDNETSPTYSADARVPLGNRNLLISVEPF